MYLSTLDQFEAIFAQKLRKCKHQIGFIRALVEKAQTNLRNTLFKMGIGDGLF
jgi:hypothetical protein